MNATLLTAGVVFLGAGIIGGGLKAFGIEVPLIQSIGRQVMLAVVGLMFLSAALLNSESTVPRPSQVRKVSVAARRNCARSDEYGEMLRTGVLLRAGERVKIAATGKWNAARFDKDKERESGPDGLDPRQWPEAILNFGQQKIPVGALIGKIGQGRVFLIGSQSLVRAEYDGELLLGFADSECDDNEGSIDVTIAPE